MTRRNAGLPPERGGGSGRSGDSGATDNSGAALTGAGAGETGSAEGRHHFERHSLPVFARIDGRNGIDGNEQLASRPGEPRGALDRFVAHVQPAGGERPDVEDDLAVAYVLHGDMGLRIDDDRQVRRQTVVDTPFIKGAQQVRLGGRLLSHAWDPTMSWVILFDCDAMDAMLRASMVRLHSMGGQRGGGLRHYFRMTFSEGVSASMKAGRENRRSAYFISGAAVFGSEMP